MQTQWLKGLVLGLGLIGCATPVDSSANSAPVAPTGLTCGPGQHVCARCNGSGTFCAPRCPECAPQLSPDSFALDSSGERCAGLL